MSRIWILIISVCSSKYAMCDYFTTHSDGTWTQMMNNCTLASPSIIYGLNNTVNIGTYLSNLADGEKVWVGYTQDYEVFRFIGCVKRNKMPTIALHSLFKADIGECYTSCGTAKYFGVSVNEMKVYNASCHCISNFRLEELNITSCKDNLPKSDFAFGGPSTVALYETVSLDVNNILRSNINRTNTDSNCFCYSNPAQMTYLWEKCSMDYSSLCTTSINGIVSHKSEKSTPWKLAAGNCLGNNPYLTAYHPNITTNQTAQQWTANIKTMVISYTTGLGPLHANTSIFRKNGYIERSGNHFTLKFDSTNSSYKALCLTGTIIPDIDVHPQADESSGNVGAYVGASLAVVIVIAAVIVVIVVVILRKRRKPSDDKEVNNMRPNLTYDTQKIQSRLEPNKAQTDDYNEIGDIATSSDDYDVLKDDLPLSLHNSSNNQYSGLHKNQTKHVLEPKTVMRNDYDYVTDTAQEHNNTDCNDYFVLEKDPGSQKKESKKQGYSGYDFAIEAGTEFPRDRDDIEHCYNTTNTTDNVDCDNYDHISKGRDQFSGEQPYDTTSQWGAGKEIDPNYDHTGAYQGQDEPYSTCGQKSPIEKEDLYNKLVQPS